MEFLDFKGLSEFFTGLFGKFATLSHKHKVADISDYTVDSSLSSSSTNPIQNKAVNSALSGKVPTSRTINGKALSSNISLTATDVGADASGTAETKANAVQANVNALNDEFSDHVENADIHFTATERTKLSGIATGANKYSHPNSGVTAGTYKSVTVNAQGHVTGGTNPNTLAGYGITDAEPKGTASSTVFSHNTDIYAHSDIRDFITGLNIRLNALADSDDTTLDQMSEVVAYIKSNKELIESITTSKINVSDIVNNLTTNSTSKVLSAAQGVAIKALIDALETELDSHTHDGRYYTESEIDTKLSGKANTSHGNHVPATETANNAKFLRNDNTWQTVTPANIGAAASSHGTHVSYSSTAPVMDGTASVGTASTVARSDHKHPTDTSRASKTEFDSHTGNTTSHITSTERTNWNAAKTHADSAHAPSNAQANQNAFSNIKVGSTTISADTTTDTLELVGSNVTITPDATNDKVTIGITKANVTAALGYTPPTTDTKYTHPTTSGNKHIPSGGSSGQILRWSADGTAAWGNDNNTTYSNFVKSGSGAKAGLVPAPSTTAGTTKYLREDGTWAVPPDNNTTYGAAGSSLGLVKSGGDVTISSGTITVNDDSHNHVISNVDGLQGQLDSINSSLNNKLSCSGGTLTGAVTQVIPEGGYASYRLKANNRDLEMHISSNGDVGLYENSHGGWIICQNTDGNVYIPHLILSNGLTGDLYSTDKVYRLSMQQDGNLVVYGANGAEWASKSSITTDNFHYSNGTLIITT